MILHIGTSGYSYPSWKGLFYPKTLSNKKMLGYYAEHFPTVESNYTFRTMPTAELLKGWAKEVPPTFQFSLKAPQLITHSKRLKDSKVPVATLFKAAAVLKKSLGPVLFQLPPNFKKDLDRLQSFLKVLPKTRRSAIEFRHQSWFDDEVMAALRKHRVALCIAEAESDDKHELKVPLVATANWGYVRLRSSDYSDAQLKKWLRWIRKQDWTDAYVFFRHEDTAKGPRMATRLMEFAKNTR